MIATLEEGQWQSGDGIALELYFASILAFPDEVSDERVDICKTADRLEVAPDRSAINPEISSEEPAEKTRGFRAGLISGPNAIYIPAGMEAGSEDCASSSPSVLAGDRRIRVISRTRRVGRPIFTCPLGSLSIVRRPAIKAWNFSTVRTQRQVQKPQCRGPPGE